MRNLFHGTAVDVPITVAGAWVGPAFETGGSRATACSPDTARAANREEPTRFHRTGQGGG